MSLLFSWLIDKAAPHGYVDLGSVTRKPRHRNILIFKGTTDLSPVRHVTVVMFIKQEAPAPVVSLIICP